MADRDTSPPRRLTPEAFFRYLVVSDIHARIDRGVLRTSAVEEAAGVARPWIDGEPRTATVRSAYRWLAAYETDGLDGLEDAPRSPGLTSLVLSGELIDFFREEKSADARASIPELIRRARERGLLADNEEIDRTTVYRTLRRMGVSVSRLRRAKCDGDMRRFAYPHRMMMVLSDGKYFRAGVGRARRVALFFLDDATRKGLHVVVDTSENEEIFLRGLYEVVERAGLMSSLYLDHGPGFIAGNTQAIVARLERNLIYGTAGYPEGHGKIERFNQSALNACLRGLDGNPEVDADLGALELRLQHFLKQYNTWPHEGLAAGESPNTRWDADPRALCMPESTAWLRERFVLAQSRMVSKDNVVSFEGTAYEVPRGHADTWIDIYRQMLDRILFIVHEGRSVRLRPVDLVANALERRGRSKSDESPAGPPPTTAAAMAFQRDFAPVVGLDGGFLDPRPEPPEDE